MKSQIFNLIILDESGSMSCVDKQTISGCNETLNTIRAIQKKHDQAQEHFVSIYTFQGDGDRPSRYLVKNQPIAKVGNISPNDYEPWGCTPLYDAVGGTLADLKAHTKGNDNATGSVTIITDGEENSSKEYTLEKVAKMIDDLKEMGWNFNFIGANIDVDRVSRSLNIDNALAFEQDDAGTREMFARERRSRVAYNDRMAEAEMEFLACMNSPEYEEMSQEDRERMAERRAISRRQASNGYFDE